MAVERRKGKGDEREEGTFAPLISISSQQDHQQTPIYLSAPYPEYHRKDPFQPTLYYITPTETNLQTSKPAPGKVETTKAEVTRKEISSSFTTSQIPIQERGKGPGKELSTGLGIYQP